MSWETEKGHGYLFHLQWSKKAFNGNNYASTKATDQGGKQKRSHLALHMEEGCSELSAC